VNLTLLSKFVFYFPNLFVFACHTLFPPYIVSFLNISFPLIVPTDIFPTPRGDFPKKNAVIFQPTSGSLFYPIFICIDTLIIGSVLVVYLLETV
jgi:hypothetical protein